MLLHTPLEIPPEALADRAQEMMRRFGYTEKPRSTFYGFQIADASAREYVDRFDEQRRNAMLATGQPAFLGFWYRQHSSEIVANRFPGGTVTYGSPANDEPGMLRAQLDTAGRLLALEARADGDTAADTRKDTIDFNALLLAAGLDPALFSPASPQQIPPVMADARMAWTGTFGQGRTEQVRVEAAAWKGRPVYFQVSGDWQKHSATPPEDRLIPVIVALGLVILTGACLLARQNLRRGRTDRRGAARVAAAMFTGWMAAWVLTADHASLLREAPLLVRALSFGAFLAGLYGAVYLALEPYARRYWPDALIPVTRLLAKRVRDPLVASNVMTGILLTQAWALCVFSALLFWPAKETPTPAIAWTLEALKSVSSCIGILIFSVGIGASMAGLLFFVLLLVRIVAGRSWIADAFLVLLIGFLVYPSGPVFVISASMLAAAALWTLRHLGLLAFLIAGATMGIGTVFSPFWYSPGSWHATRALILPFVVTAAAAWALWVIVSSEARSRTIAAADDSSGQLHVRW